MADNLTVSIGVDTAKFRADLAVAQAAAKDFGKQLREAAAEARKGGDDSFVRQIAASTVQAEAKVRSLKDAIREHHRVAGDTSHWTRATAAVKGFGESSGRVIGEVNGAIGNMVNRTFPALTAAAGLSAAGIVAGFASIVTGAEAATAALVRQAAAIGQTTEFVEAARLGLGGSADETDQMLERLTVAVAGMRKPFADLFRAGGGSAGQNELDALAKADPVMSQLKLTLRDIGTSGKLSEHTLERIGAQLLKLQQRDAPAAAAVGKVLLGKEWDDSIGKLTTFTERLLRGRKELAETGGAIGEQAKADAKAFNLALASMGNAWTRLRDQIGAALAPILTPLLVQFKQTLLGWTPLVRQWVADNAAYLRDAVQEIINFMRGLRTPISTDLAAGFINTFTFIKDTLIPGVAAAFQGLWSVLGSIASAVNAAFGTNFNAAGLAAIVVIGQLTGAFQLMIGVLTALGSLMLALVALNPWIALAVAIAGAATAVYLFRDSINAAVQLNAPRWLADIYNWLDQIGRWQATGTIRELKAISDAIQVAWDAARRFLETLGLIGARQGAATGGSAAGYAGGGPIPGRGTGDTVPAWLTPGEFVINRRAAQAFGPTLRAINNFGRLPSIGASMGAFGMRRFASGGMVTAAADGGGRAPVHLHLGGHSFALSGASGVVGALVAEAGRHQLRSAGTKPSWYGGRLKG